MMSCRGYYCNETGLGLSTSVCFIKSFGPRVGSGDDPLPDPSVYDTKDHLKKNERVAWWNNPKTLRVLAQSVSEHDHVNTKRVRIVQNTLMRQEFLPTLKNPRFSSG